jgi:mannose-6-phosphate isomerase-like protein (cupin superfamily)
MVLLAQYSISMKEPPMNDTTPLGATAAEPTCAWASARDFYTMETLVLAPYNPGVPLHQHSAHAQSYYIIAGTLAVTHSNHTITLTCGELFVIPPGVTHTCWNPTAAPTTLLVSYHFGGESDSGNVLVAGRISKDRADEAIYDKRKNMR